MALEEKPHGEDSACTVNDITISTTKYTKITKNKISKFFMPFVV
jgi:hypothetical protein